MTIERYPGTVVRVGGIAAIVGGGMYGETPQLDQAVQKAAEMLSAAFHTPVIIRFNSDRLSGGAWLKDGRQDFWANGQVGLTVCLCHVKPESMTEDEWFRLPIGSWGTYPKQIRIFTVIHWESLKDRSQANAKGGWGKDYAYHNHATLEEGLAYLLKHAEPAMAQEIY